MSLKKVLIFPNTGITYKQDDFYLSSTELSFLEEVVSGIKKTSIVGKIHKKDNQFHDKTINKTIEIISLNYDKGMKKEKSKISFIAKTVLFTFNRIRKKYFFYLYLPNNLALIILPLIIICRSNFGIYLRGDWKRGGSFVTYIYQLAFKKADFIICTGRFFKKELLLFNHQVDEVVPMLSLETVPVYQLKEAKSVPKILYVGRIEYAKGILDLLKAIKNLRDKKYTFELTLIGENRLTKEIDSFLSDFPYVKEVLTCTGQITDKTEINKYYSEADIFVFPSHHEGFPRVLYEAMLFNLPIISTQLPNISEFFNDDSAILVPVKSPVLLERAIESLLKDFSFRVELGDKAYNKYKEIHKNNINNSHGKQVIEKIKNLR